jgi:hypothetical protein
MQELEIIHYLIDPGKPYQNGKVERFHRICEEEFYQKENFKDLNSLRKKFRDFLYYYNKERESLALEGLTPLGKIKNISTIFKHQSYMLKSPKCACLKHKFEDQLAASSSTDYLSLFVGYYQLFHFCGKTLSIFSATLSGAKVEFLKRKINKNWIFKINFKLRAKNGYLARKHQLFLFT